MVKSAQARNIYVAPVNTQYVNQQMNSNGQWVTVTQASSSEIEKVANLMRSSFISAIQNTPATNFVVKDQPGPDTMNLELALRQLVPTSVGVNSVADVGGLLLPGSKLVEDAVSVGGQAAGGALAAGSIAMEFKLVSGSGVLLAEAQDRENDPASILPNVKDFEAYGWSERTVKEWAQQFADVFSTSGDTTVSNESLFSMVPW